MKKLLSKPYRWAALYSVILTASVSFTLLDTFVLPKSLADASLIALPSSTTLHYIVIVSDGRTSEREGLSLLQLAQELKDRGCTVAYNLDGGGSSTMYFHGKVINKPTNGRRIGERKVSDIVYFGF